MTDQVRRRVRELADYLGVEYDETADLACVTRAFACDAAYLTAEPELPAHTVQAIARVEKELSNHDREEARRFAAYLLHTTSD